MKILNNMTVRLSWLLVLAVFAVLVVGLSVLGLYSVSYAERSQAGMAEFNRQQQEQFQQVVGLQAIETQLQDLQTQLAGEQERLAQAVQREQAGQASAPSYQADTNALEQKLKSLQDALAAFAALPRDESYAKPLESLKKRFATLVDSGLRLQLQELGKRNPAVAAFHANATRMYAEPFLKELRALGQQLAKGPQMPHNELEGVALAIRLAIFAALVLCAAITAVVLWGVSRNVIRPLERVVEHCQQIANGNLAGHIEAHSDNEIGQLFKALHDIQQRLAATVGTVRHSSRLIHSGAQEVAEGSSSLSTRTVQQAASLQSTASSMEQLTSTVAQNADNARQASGLADTAAKAAQRGGEVVSRVITTMGGISESSHQVEEIIKLIDSIAFQTNILALNASVEAARAGEQGRGFAVVAGEVRNLAGRSAQAAKEIRDLITASVEQVDTGSRLVAESGSVMQEIVESVQKVADIMDEIAAASQEQSEGIALVDQAVEQMDAVTQQNTNMVQQANHAASELVGEANRLREAVEGFRLDAAFEVVTAEDAAREDGSWAKQQYDQARRGLKKKETPALPGKPQEPAADEDWQTF